MTSLVIAAALFFGTHVLLSSTRLREVIVTRTGEKAFQALYSLISLVTIVWLCKEYARAGDLHLWGPLDALRPLVLVPIALAFLLAVIGVTTPSPTATGGESQLDQEESCRGILRVTRHPFLWGVAIWAFVHSIVTGDAASLILFGTFLLLALAGPPLIDAKRRNRLGDKWDRFAAITSSVPFAAIVQGRSSFRLAELGWLRIAAGLVVFGVFLGIHPWLFGG